jgi:hypothetical protein
METPQFSQNMPSADCCVPQLVQNLAMIRPSFEFALYAPYLSL